MKLRIMLFAVLCLAVAGNASAWNCPSGQHHVQVSKGTPGAVLVEGEYFSCVPDAPPSDPKTTNQQQNQNQNQTATATSGSSSAVNNSGNSSNTNKNTNTNTANGGNASSTSSATGGSASNNSSGNQTSFSSSYQEVRQTPIAYSPESLSTSPCVKGFSGGLSLPGGAGSLGMSKIDKGCDSRQTAVIFHGLGNDTAAAKVLCSTDASKRAKLTLEDCAAIVRTIPVPVATPVQQIPNVTIPVTIEVPPQITAPIVEKQAVTIYEGSFIMDQTPGSKFCPAPRALVTDKGRLVLDEAVRNIGSGKLVLTGNPRNTVASLRYLSRSVNKSRILIQVDDSQNLTVQVRTAN